MCSAQQVKRFRKSAAYSDFDRKWQTGVYFQILRKDLLASLESDIGGEISVATELGPDGLFVSPLLVLTLQELYLTVSRSTLQLISKCWSEAVFIRCEVGKFLQLSLTVSLLCI